MTNEERSILIEWIEKQKNGFKGSCSREGVISYKEYTPKHYLDEFGNVKPIYGKNHLKLKPRCTSLLVLFSKTANHQKKITG